MAEATRILVVDDDPKIRTVVRRGLAYEGYRVVEAATVFKPHFARFWPAFNGFQIVLKLAPIATPE